jgi:peroxiredoxin
MAQPTTHEIDSAAGAHDTCRLASPQALRAGDHAPDFTLPDHDGHLVSLTSDLENGPAILSFLDGRRRTDADAQLLALTICSAQIVGHGAAVLAISPAARSRVEGAGAFRVLHDAGSLVAGSYGLFRSTEAGTVPATFVIDQGSTIVMSLINAAPASDQVCVNVVSALSALRRIEGRRL